MKVRYEGNVGEQLARDLYRLLVTVVINYHMISRSYRHVNMSRVLNGRGLIQGGIYTQLSPISILHPFDSSSTSS